MSSFSFLKLPFLAQEVVLLQLSSHDITDFSLCSKRCQRIVRQTRHPYTGINIIWNKHLKYIIFDGGNSTRWLWAINYKLFKRPQNPQFRSINGRKIPAQKMGAVFCTWSTVNSVVDIKVILDHLRDTFNLKVINVDLNPDDIGFRNFVSCIGECQNFRCSNFKPMRRDDQQYILDNVNISGVFKSSLNFID